MKSEHRHELKTNELADWMAHFPEWAQENARTLIGVAVLVVVVAGVFFWVQYNKNVRTVGEQVRFSNLLAGLPQTEQKILNNSDQGQDASFMFSSVATGLENYADKSSHKTMAALAYLKCAEAQRAALHYSTTPTKPEELPEKIAPIQKNYHMAIEKATDAPSIRAAARYGLGLCFEELGQFSEAETAYRELVADKTLYGTSGQAAAKYRLEVFKHYEQPVAFKPAPEPKAETLPVVPKLSEDINSPVAGPALPTESAEVPDSNTSEK